MQTYKLSFLTLVIFFANIPLAHSNGLSCAENFSLIVSRPIEIPNDYRLLNGHKHSKYRKFISEITELREKINSLISNKLNRIESVIYPAAGFDSGYPFMIAPNAKVVVGLDDNPFITLKNFKLKNKVKPAQPFGYSTYMHFSLIENLPGLSHQIVANIKGLGNNVRIRSVEAFMVQGESKFMESQTEHIPIHGLVRFDRGEGTPEQIYVHVNRFFSSLEETSLPLLKNSWWMGMISSRRLGLFYKGAGGITEEPTIDVLEQLFIGIPGSVYVAAENEATVRYYKRSDNTLVALEDSKRGYKKVRMPYFQDSRLEKHRVRAKLGYNSVGGSKGGVDIIAVPELENKEKD